MRQVACVRFTNGDTVVKSVKQDDGSLSKILLSIHVDDGIAACNDEVFDKYFIAAESKDFDISNSGEFKWFLGCKVQQDRTEGLQGLT